MKIRKTSVVLLATASMLGTALAPPAAAVGGGTFRCRGNFPVWPTTSGSSTWCAGRAQGVFQGGTELVVCLPDCYFEMTMHYAATCIANEPPTVAVFAGDIEIWGTGVLRADYSATMTGGHVTITTSSPSGVGEAVLTMEPPFPTCANPGSPNFEMTGWLAFS